MKRWVLGFILVFTLSSLPAFSATPPKPGSICSKSGITKIYKGKKYSCIKSGKKLVWNKGSKIKMAVPAPAKSEIPKRPLSPTTTPSPSQKPILPPSIVTNLSASWTGELGDDLLITFDHDSSLISSTVDNSGVDSYSIVLKHIGSSAPSNPQPQYFGLTRFDRNSIRKEWTLTRNENSFWFLFADQFEISVIAQNGFNGLKSSFATINSPLYQSKLNEQTISVIPILGGYEISFVSDKNILFLEVWENIANDSPDRGWYRVSNNDGKTNPFKQYVLTTQPRSVKIRVWDRNGKFKESNVVGGMDP
jgi:hypothetical protein